MWRSLKIERSGTLKSSLLLSLSILSPVELNNSPTLNSRSPWPPQSRTSGLSQEQDGILHDDGSVLFANTEDCKYYENNFSGSQNGDDLKSIAHVRGSRNRPFII